MQNLFSTLLSNYLNEIDGAIAVSICDRDGLTIASQDKEEFNNESIIGVVSAVLDSYIDRIKQEFGDKTETNFMNITSTGDKKFVYCSMGPNSILTTVANLDTSDIALRIYSEHVASKVELLIAGNEDVSLKIPEIIRTLANTKGGTLPTGEFSTKLILVGDFQVGKTSLINRFVKNEFQESYISTIGVEISKKVVDIIEKWFNEIKDSVSNNVPIVIVGNKSDLSDVVVSEQVIKEIADKHGFHYILTSAKTGENVNDAFIYIAYKFLETI
ncbi:MAG: hypothetical protein ACTSQD_01955 [Promethearchaeota archaeon]